MFWRMVRNKFFLETWTLVGCGIAPSKLLIETPMKGCLQQDGMNSKI
jgi:hypothetical protein